MKSVKLWREILHSHCITKGVVAYNAGDGALLEACILTNIPAVGFCMTQKHGAELEDRLTRQLHYYLKVMPKRIRTMYLIFLIMPFFISTSYKQICPNRRYPSDGLPDCGRF